MRREGELKGMDIKRKKKGCCFEDTDCPLGDYKVKAVAQGIKGQ